MQEPASGTTEPPTGGDEPSGPQTESDFVLHSADLRESERTILLIVNWSGWNNLTFFLNGTYNYGQNPDQATANQRFCAGFQAGHSPFIATQGSMETTIPKAPSGSVSFNKLPGQFVLSMKAYALDKANYSVAVLAVLNTTNSDSNYSIHIRGEQSFDVFHMPVRNECVTQLSQLEGDDLTETPVFTRALNLHRTLPDYKHYLGYIFTGGDVAYDFELAGSNGTVFQQHTSGYRETPLLFDDDGPVTAVLKEAAGSNVRFSYYVAELPDWVPAIFRTEAKDAGVDPWAG